MPNIEKSTLTTPAAAGPAKAVSGKILKLEVERQIQTQWCWAAVAVNTNRFYGGPIWTQCKLVNLLLDRTDCCDEPCPAPCNKPYKLGEALALVGHLASRANGSESYSTVRSQIDSNYLLCARIDWGRGGAHFVMIIGYETNPTGEYLHIEDPASGSSTVTLDTFTKRYQDHGTWSFTFFTK